MDKNKLNLIIDKYCLDTRIIPFIIFPIMFSVFFAFGIFDSLIYLIPTVVCVLLVAYMLYKIVTTKKKISTNELVTVSIVGYKAYIKETQETSRNSSQLIKLYIVDANNKKYSYYYLNGLEIEFKEYTNIINESENIKLVLFAGTNIISSIIADGVKLKDLYQEIRHSVKLIKPVIYNHIKYKRTKKGIYKYEEYSVTDVKMVFERSTLYEELIIINKDNKYVKISYNQETHNEFFVGNQKFDTFNEMEKELQLNDFIIDDKVRVIYTLGDAEPSSFISVINKVK